MFPWKKAAKCQPVACPNIITPDRIPPFLIPPNLASIQGRHLCRNQTHKDFAHGDRAEKVSGPLQGASSMPQLSGIPLLPESPHTRRRESLFHNGQTPHRCHFTRFTAPQTHLAPESDTASSTETSPYSSPLLMRSLGALPLCRGYRRRCGSRSTNAGMVSRPSSLSTEETSSTDTSPSFPRRETEPPWGHLTPTSFFPLDWVRCRERLTKEVVLTVSKGGRVRLSSEYLQPQGRLRIRLVSAEAFYPSHCDPRHIHCCVSLRLRPGLRQRQRSAVVKRSRDPIFNEDFFFEGLSVDDLPRLSLRLKVLNKGSGMRRDAVLGECDIPLDSLLP
ncbi:C2 calcium-dependent domain-containing protein 4D [Anolis carolinensis]|uniref:C2 calcium-dependent domain-containing protein 4D n=1 Tax=Anolis carolinensis TaxID=28377 RepID=UPI0004624DF8|nr:PREDICTED: C2 calcium-dependent domain-containing protein 4D [Anolis carolinensis]|eukprot:XP_008122077.1 PREDICTED: C2 calcium-dependent domain-containing protein 4D [Anolis carolinensis]